MSWRITSVLSQRPGFLWKAHIATCPINQMKQKRGTLRIATLEEQEEQHPLP